MELAYGTQSTATQAQFSDLVLFVVSRRFLAIPVLLGLAAFTILRLCNESCASTVDSTVVLLQRGGEQTIYVHTRNNHTCQLPPLTQSQSSPDCDRWTNTDRHENHKVTIGPAGRAVCALLVKRSTATYICSAWVCK